MTAPQKDIVYIDVDDDITAIIGKLKSAHHAIVALVPPKRIGVLQSAVNLRLLARAAKQGDKRLVIITNNQALVGLAASAQIPVAKNLQSKPEIAEIAALEIDDGDEVIDGAELPIGQHMTQAQAEEAGTPKAALGAVAVTDTSAAAASKSKPRSKSGAKVPNFDIFRKKLVLIVLAAIFLIGFLVWAIFFAPNARVILAIRTSDAAISQQVALATGIETSVDKSTIAAVKKEITDEVSIEFDATGKKEVGEKATGTVDFSNDSARALSQGITIPAGTKLTSSGGMTYSTDETVNLTLENLGNDSSTITATSSGADYNDETGSMSGASSDVNAELASATSGGTDKTITVVTKEDVQKAQDGLDEKLTKDKVQGALTKQVGSEFIVIGDSFRADTGDVRSNLEVDSEAPNGKAQLVGKVKYSLIAVSKSEVSKYLEAVIKQQFDNGDQQRVYSTGVDDVKFTDVRIGEQGVQATLTTNGKIGPQIDDERIKEVAKGKGYGAIQSELVAINGIESVDIKFSPFWVNKAPNNVDKISVESKLNE